MLEPILEKDLIDDSYYSGASNEVKVARWNKAESVFEYMFDNKIKKVKLYDEKTPTDDGFYPLFEIGNINSEVIKTNKLQVKKN